jgi:predicted AAA+ superfamily ATPase
MPLLLNVVHALLEEKDALQTGMIPLIFAAPHKQDVLHVYIGLYLKEEIQMEGLVCNIENFSRFLEIISFSHGTILNITNVSRECEVKRKTVENYIEILETLLLAYRISVLSNEHSAP